MNMKDRWLYVSAALVLVMAAAACQEELSLEPVMETPAREEYRPWFRSVEVNVCGMDEFEQAGTKGAITSGGVSVDEIVPKSMMSKIHPGLFFAGEILDVDAYTGGFNLQIAFSTAYLAGKSSAEFVS